MDKLDYSVTLFDAPISEADRNEAINLYRSAIESHLGSAQAVAEAAQEYQRLIERYEEYPLPDEATDAEKSVADLWIEAEREGERAAFADWLGDPGPANFVVDVFKPHFNAGNQHASKGGYDGHLNMRCMKRDKAGWVKQAQREGLKLSEWVNKTLNAAAEK